MLAIFQLQSHEFFLSVASIFQNEAPYLREWIEYHKLQGVEHFWLYNNNSTDNFYDVLEPYIIGGLVELIEWSHTQNDNDFSQFSFEIQPKAYMNAVNRSKKRTKWLALIDIDEFLYPISHSSISECLNKKFDKEVGLYIHWLNFGHSNIQKVLPTEILIEKLVMSSNPHHDKNKFRKSIVKPKYVSNCINPHYCLYKSGNHREDQKVDEYLRINHYWCRDIWYTENIKIPRYIKWGTDPQKIREDANTFNTHINLEIQRFVTDLKNLLIN